ncbi:hypothetical protein [Pseudomonas graminis]
MNVFNPPAPTVSSSGATIGAQGDAHKKALPGPQAPVQWDLSIGTQKKADDELARFLADVHGNIGLWRPLSTQTSVGKWLELFNQSWAAPQMQAWIQAQHLVPRSLHLKGATLTAQKLVDGKPTSVTFTPSDGSGWWPIGRQAIASAAILDPKQSGLVGNSRAVLWPEHVTAFYGLTWPLNNAQADQLRVSGFPAVGMADDPSRSPQVRELAARAFMDTQQEAELIRTLLGVVKDRPGDEKMDLGTIMQAITPGSSFAIANKSKPQLLKDLRDHPRMIPILRACQADWAAQVRLVDGELFIKSRGRSGQWNNVTQKVRAQPDLAPLLDKAVEAAKDTRNILNSGAKADARQLLRFAGMDELPDSVTVFELQNLLNWKLNPLPPGPSSGSYARDFLTDPQSPEYLSRDQRVRVQRSAAGAGTPLKLTLLDCSPQPWSGKTLEQVRESADQLIAQSLTQGAGLARCRPILAALKDDPAAATADTLPSYRQQMILTRDLLCVDPGLGLKRNHIAGYDLYSVSNSGKTLSEVRTELERHIGATQQIPMDQAVLITHALLATVAPEFLVKGAGEERVGSLTLVNLRVQTALVELASPGSSRGMNTEQISSRAFLTPLSNDHQQLQAAQSGGPIYDWAVAQGVITSKEHYSPQAMKLALTSYDHRLTTYDSMTHDLDKARSASISRLKACRHELERVCPGQSDFFRKATIYAEPDSTLYTLGKAVFEFSTSVSGWGPSIADGKPVSTAEHIVDASSIYDLYVSGALTADNVASKRWKFKSPEDRLKFESLKPQLSQLKPVNEVFDHSFTLGTEYLEKFKLMSTRVMMSDMPLEDRNRLEFGEVFVFGAAEYQRPDGDVSQAQAQQKMGPILYARDASGAQCYEFLPSTSSYRLRPELLDGMSTLAKVDMEKNRDRVLMLQKHYATLPADIDVKAHFPARHTYRDASTQAPNTYSSSRTNELIKVFKDNQMLINRELMLTAAKGITKLESIQQRFDAAESFLVNTLIPFKGNIEDIASGDPKRMAMGGIGLGLEIFGALFVVAGAISAPAKGASIAFRLGKFGKAALSMFDLPGAVLDTGKSLFRLSAHGVKSLGKVAPKAWGKGLSDFRKLASGGNIEQLLKPWTAGATGELLSNAGLINTTIGTQGFTVQAPPVPSNGSTTSPQTYP